MNILIVCFSLGSTVWKVAEALRAQLEVNHTVTLTRIEPARPRSYWAWLFLSLIPNSQVAIRPTTTDLRPYGLVCLGFPKWSLSCPPVNEYVARMQLNRGKKFALFMCHAGFGADRFLRVMVRKLSRRGVRVVATLSLFRRAVQEGTYYPELRLFCREIRRAG